MMFNATPNRLKRFREYSQQKKIALVEEYAREHDMSLDAIDYDSIELPAYYYDGRELFNKNGHSSKHGILLYDEHYYLMLNTRHCMKKIGYEWCETHLDYMPMPHKCARYMCFACDTSYTTKQKLAQHQEKKSVSKCKYCSRPHKFKGCQRSHKCSKSTKFCMVCKCYVHGDLDRHVANGCFKEIKCGNCNKYDSCASHRCFLKSKAKPASSKYFVYDIESYLGENGRQEFAMAWIMSLDLKTKVFVETAEEFAEWIAAQGARTILFAHNGGKYDNIIMREQLLTQDLKPSSVCQNGYKIIQFKIKNVTFRDTVAHISMSLKQMPDAFGESLQKTQFPYRFFTRENKDYSGSVPIEYYESADAEEIRSQYDIYNEGMCSEYHVLKESGGVDDKSLFDVAKEYCHNDVEVLAKCVAKYRRSMIELTTIDPLLYITKASYAYAVYTGVFMPKNTISYLQPNVADFIRSGFAGGRTNCLVRKYTGKVKSKDVSSLYPAVQMFDLLPARLIRYDYGNTKPFKVNICLPQECYVQPIRLEDASDSKDTSQVLVCNKYIHDKFDAGVVGFYKCDITVPRDIYIPVLGIKQTKYLFTNNDIKRQVYYTTELMEAIANGYVIERIYDYAEFTSSTDLFAGFVKKFYSLKQKMKNNPAMYVSIKILLNSLWGKFAENVTNSETIVVASNDRTKRVKLHSEELRGKRRLIGESYIKGREEDYSIRSYKKITDMVRQTKGSIAVAAAVTANARVRLYEALKFYNKRVLYFDTDSVYYKDNEESVFKPSAGHVVGGLGDWDDELTGTEFISIGAKMYGIKSHTDIVKSKGVPKGSINYKILSDLVDGKESYACKIKNFRASRLGVAVEDGLKIIRDTCTKRVYSVGKDGHFSLPFGAVR
jgi:hypothetical protein